MITQTFLTLSLSVPIYPPIRDNIVVVFTNKSNPLDSNVMMTSTPYFLFSVKSCKEAIVLWSSTPEDIETDMYRISKYLYSAFS